VNEVTRRRFGGADAFGWWVFALGAPASIASHLLFAGEGGLALGAVLLASAAGYLAMGACWWLLGATLFAHRREHPLSLATVIVGSFATGCVRSGVSVALWSTFGSAVPIDTVAGRVLSGGLIASVVVPLATYVVASIRDYRTRRAELVAEAITLHASRLETDAIGERLAEVVSTQAQEQVDVAFAPVREALAEGDIEPNALARQLQRINADVLRPTSHEMWAREASQSVVMSGVSWSRVLDLRYLPVLPIGAIWGVSVMTLTITRFGWAWGSIAVLVSSAACMFGLWLARVIARRLDSRGLLVLLFAVPATAVFGSVLTSLVPGVDPARIFADSPITVLWLATLVAAVALADGAIRRFDQIVAELVAEVDEERIALASARHLQSSFEQRVGQLIHSRVQGRIHGVVSQIQAAPNGADLTWVADQLSNLTVTPSRSPEEPLEARLRSLTMAWNEFLDVTVHCQVSTVDAAVQGRVMDIASEAVTNAFRHGKAMSVVIDIRQGGDILRVRIIDDGTGLSDSKPAGMGSKVFTHAAPGSWSLANASDGGCVFLAELQTSA